MAEKIRPTETIRCIDCAHFKHYRTAEFEPAMESLGQCVEDPWDGFKTQWPYLKHPCKSYKKRN